MQGYAEKLKGLGVEVYDAQGNIRSLYNIMLDASNVYRNMTSDAEKYSLLEVLGGKQQASVVASIIQNIGTMESAYETAMNAQGSATREQEVLMESLSARINSLKENFVGLWTEISDSDAMKSVITSLDGLITSLRENDIVIQGIGNTISGTMNFISSMINNLGLLGTVVAVVTAKLGLTNDKFKSFASNVSGSIPVFNKLPATLQKWTTNMGATQVKMQELVSSQKNVVSSVQAGGTGYATANAKLLAYKTGLAASKVATVGLEVATLALNAALTMGIGLLVTTGIQALMNFANKQHELAEANQEFVSSLDEVSDGMTHSFNDLTSISTLINQYKELTSNMAGMTKGSDEYNLSLARALELQDQLKTLLPEVNQCFIDGIELKGLDIEATENLIGAELELAKAKANAVLEENGVDGLQDIKDEVLGYKQLQAQIEAVNQAKETGAKMSWGDVSFDGANSQISAYVRDLDDYIESLEEQKAQLEANYEAYELLDGGTGRYAEQLNYLREALGYTNEEMSNFTTNSNSADATNLVDQLESVESSADEATNALSEMYDTFDALSGNIELINQVVEELNNYGALNTDTYDKVLSSGSAELIAGLGDANNALAYYTNLVDKYTESRANSAKEMIDYAVACVNGTADSANAINNIAQESAAVNQQIVDNIQQVADGEKSIYEGVAEQYRNKINEQIGATDDLFNIIAQQMNQYVANGNQVYGFDTQNYIASLNSKEEGNVQWVNAVMQQVAQAILANSENYSQDTVAWAEAINNKVRNNDTASSAFTSAIADAVNSMSGLYSTDVNNFANATQSKINMYNEFTGSIRQAFQVMNSSGFDTLTEAYAKMGEETSSTTKSILQGTKADLDALMSMNSTISNVTSGYVGTTVSGSNISSGVSASGVGGNYVGSTGVSSGGSGGSGSSGSGSSASAERTQADMESLVKIYAELEKAIDRTNGQLSLYQTLQESSKGQESVKYIELQIGLYKQLQTQQEDLLRVQQNRANELRSILSSNGFNITNDGAISNYQSQLDALVNTANAIGDAETKQKRQEEVKELSSLIDEYNDLVGKDLLATQQEIAEINNQIKDMYSTKVSLVTQSEANIYSVIENYANKQVEAQKKALEEVQKAREKMREDDDYEKDKAQKISDLADIEAQMEILSMDSSRAGQLKLQELQAQYDEIMEELNSTVQDRQDALFDEMIDNETTNLEEQLEEFLSPANINKVIADALNSGFVDIMGTTYNLQDAMAGFIQESTIGFTTMTEQTNEWLDALTQAQSAFVGISDSYTGLGWDAMVYNQGQDFNNQVNGNNNITATYVLQFPENIGSVDRATVEAIVQPMLDYAQADTVTRITEAIGS